MKFLRTVVPALTLASASLVLPMQPNFQAKSVQEFASNPVTEIESANAAYAAFACIRSGTLNVRSGPSTGYRVVGSLSKNQSLSIIKWNRNGDWVLITANYGRTYGWAAAWHVCFA